jgi:beta-lactamase class A
MGRRRRPTLAQRLASRRVLIPAATIVVLFGVLDAAQGHKRSHGHQTTARTAAHVTTARTHARATATSTVNPLGLPAMRRNIDGRQGDISVAVENLYTKRIFLWNAQERAQTASIVKADILETLLHQAMVSNTPLSDDTADEVQGMIENSNNTDASELWDQVGGASGVAAYDQLVGMTQTVPAGGGYWGETMTSARDQIRLLQQLVDKHSLLDPASRRYQLGLMESVESDQQWGVSGGVPAGVSVALKNGWVPLTSYTDWEVNSIGRIKGDGRDYLIAVLTAHDPSEQYGIDSIEGISSIVWNALAPS